MSIIALLLKMVPTSQRLNSLKKNYDIKNTLGYILSFLEQIIKEMDRRFNDTAVSS
jgi:hypothetical protein